MKKFLLFAVVGALPAVLLAQEGDGAAQQEKDVLVDRVTVIPGTPSVVGAAAGVATWGVRRGPLTIPFPLDGSHAGQPVGGAPFSAEAVSETVQVLADGNRIRQENRTVIHRDSEGRTRHETSFGGALRGGGGPAKTIVTIYDPVAGVQYTIDEERKAFRKMSTDPAKWPLPGARPDGAAPRALPAPADAPSAARAEPGAPPQNRMIVAGLAPSNPAPNFETRHEALGERMIEGVKTQGERMTTVFPPGAMGNEREIETVFERWHSPELHADVLTRRIDPRMGETTYRLTNIQRVEPLPSVFEPPAGYLEDPDQVLPVSVIGRRPE
jgi:hypothetical protein